jgi:hypothetical protein
VARGRCQKAPRAIHVDSRSIVLSPVRVILTLAAKILLESSLQYAKRLPGALSHLTPAVQNLIKIRPTRECFIPTVG